MKRLYLIFLTILICSVSFDEAKQAKSKSVTTLLDAKWNATPIVLEVAEYLAEENADSFWNFVNAICNLKEPIAGIGK